MEALIHFNIGKNGEHKQHEYIRISDQIKIHIPDKDEFLKIVKTVLFFSTMTGLLHRPKRKMRQIKTYL
jgi:hypothetical protein